MPDLKNPPRMKDFAEILGALDETLGTHAYDFYISQQNNLASEIVDTDYFLSAIKTQITERFEGTAKELHDLLKRPANDKYWPEPRGMPGKLKRAAPRLRAAGLEVTEVPAPPGSKRAATWILVPAADGGVTDQDLLNLKAMLDEQQRDIADWGRMLISNGAQPQCASVHAHHMVLGAKLGGDAGYSHLCDGSDCTISVPMSGPEKYARWDRAERLERQLKSEMDRLKITGLDDLNQKMQERGLTGPFSTEQENY